MTSLPSPLSACPDPKVADLVLAVRACPESAGAWWALLACLEARPLPGLDLLQVYTQATHAVPRQGNQGSDAYVRLWLGFARQQWHRDCDDARDTLKTLRRQAIGSSSPLLFLEWAALEWDSGARDRASAVLAKGLRDGAQPPAALEAALADVAAGVWSPVPLWQQSAASAGPHTAALTCTASTYEAFVTPGAEAERPARASHTHTLEALVPSGLPPDSGAPGRPLPGSSLVDRGAACAGVEAARGPALLARLCAGAPGSATGPGGLGQGAGAPGTALSRGSASSSSSRGSEEATVCMGGRQSGPGLSRLGGAANEDTIVVRRCLARRTPQSATLPLQRPGFLTEGPHVEPAEPAAATPSAAGMAGAKRNLLRPRRMGVLGRALRVAPGSDSANEPAAGDAAAAGKETGTKVGEAHTDIRSAGEATDLKRKAAAPGAGGEAACKRATGPPPSPGDAPGGSRGPALEARGRADAGPGAGPPLRTLAGPRPGQLVLDAGDLPADGPGGGSMVRRQPPAVDEEETAPVLLSKLAARVRGGRQSLAPAKMHRVVLEAGEQTPGSGGEEAEEATLPLQPGAARRGQCFPPARRDRNNASLVSSGRRVVEDDNTVVVKGISYTKLECVGRGGSSKVYKVMAPNRKIFALKRIRLTGRDSEAAAGFIDEITLLNSLRGKSNIIQLIDAEVYRAEGIIFMVLECGEIDLARLLQKREAARKEHDGGAASLDENFIRLYWEQMLRAVHTIHEVRIVHSDIKPANFLVVEGQLKLIDFGIAKAIQSDTTSIARESQVGTLNYMSPEAILGGQNNIKGGPPMKVGWVERRVGRASDIWSLGCILYQMVYGATPFSHLPFIQKMHAIIDPSHAIAFPPLPNPALAEVLRRCLDREPKTRVGRASDIWSLGCILYQMVYGATPFSHLPFIQKMHAIIDPSHAIAFPPLPNPALAEAVHTIHEVRIVHSDIKPANFLVVEGQLKLIDFGIAKAIQSDTTSIARESQVGTLNYMSPEAILGGQNNIKGGPPMKVGWVERRVGRASDIWSLGCILYQMVYGATPFSHLPFIQKMHAIIDPSHAIAFPPLPNPALAEVFSQLSAGLSPQLPSTRSVGRAARGGGSEAGDGARRGVMTGAGPSRLAGGGAGTPDPGPGAAVSPSTDAPGSSAPGPQGSGVAAQAARAAASRAAARAVALAALESGASDGATSKTTAPRAPLHPISQTALATQAAALRRVNPQAAKPRAAEPAAGSLEDKLRRGLQRFNFEGVADAAQGTSGSP
ncbi:putative serine/threonine-protein kinase mps1 [Auxenochlorella protothecoides]|uniref:Putative serine/threonine-protein kinase mps1 n=1 Tax=Auxenochlorella protothecoides TaxID=3075 RepID=A0A087SUB8_AUXPR|nr:putative serine/threonine-protein kinase mps1 [Auxenochlorella protothecoides]KFM29322.1 putative serine/threonine-protein kinase mps1 [Auxenochlorella protothecoides]